MNADQISSYRPEGKGSQQCAIQGSILIREIKGPILEENLYDLDDAKFPSSYCSYFIRTNNYTISNTLELTKT